MKRKLKKLWQMILVLSIPISIAGLIFWGCCIDGGGKLPVIMCGINAGWLLLICAANEGRN